MPVVAVISPCFTLGSGCHADWAAISAIGGWLGAVAATFAAFVALGLAASERKKREAQQRAAHKLAMMSLWPRLHRAQGIVASIVRIIGAVEEDRPTAATRDQLLVLIDTLEGELAEIRSLGMALEGVEGEQLAAAAAIAGFVAKQTRRIARPESAIMLDAIWYSQVRKSWADDGRAAVDQLLAFTSKAETVVNSVSGRTAPDFQGADVGHAE